MVSKKISSDSWENWIRTPMLKNKAQQIARMPEKALDKLIVFVDCNCLSMNLFKLLLTL